MPPALVRLIQLSSHFCIEFDLSSKFNEFKTVKAFETYF